MTDEILKPGERSKPTFAMSIDTRLLYERYQKLTVGEQITYQEMSDLIGRDVRNGARGAFMSARRRAERLDNIVFGVVRGEGLVRLNDEEIVKSGESLLKRSRKSARRGFARMGHADYEKLTEGIKADHNAYASMFNALIAASKPSTFKRVREQVAQSQQTLPLAATLKAFEK